jgi:hypothetical protein|nr:MAG TPA: hypothetical protein [Caudoviricetes sp.]
MTIEDKIKNSYFEWMVDLVCGNRFSKDISYRKLLTLLHIIEFRYSVPRDENRARDGVNLRYRYSFVNGYDDLSEFIDGPCSVLEMMVSLAIECENIMNDPAYGDRTAQWFWGMITNLGLGDMYDKNFDKKEATDRINQFLDRDYSPDGKGGLFTARNSHRDMRKLEIWYQMQEFLNDIV